MKMPLFKPLCPGEIGGIVNLALSELGLDEAFLLEALVRAGGRPKFNCRSGEWALDKIDVGEWLWICNLLHLSMDSISYGYCRWEHKFRVGKAASEGLYVLPMTNSARALIREYYGDLKRNVRDEVKHYGDPLLTRIRKERYQQMIVRRFERRQNHRTRRVVRLQMLLARHVAIKKTSDPIPRRGANSTQAVPRGLTVQRLRKKGSSTKLHAEARADG